MKTELSKAYKENYFISEDAIVKRYLEERKLVLRVAAGDYEGVREVLDNMPHEPEDFLDFIARSPNNVDRRIRDMALITNTELRTTLLHTNVPVTLLHGLATYWGQVINKAPIEDFSFETGGLFKSIYRSYCELAREFNQERYSPTVDRIVNFIFYHLASQITPARIAEEFNYSSIYINRLLKKETGYSTVQYIKQKRISLAKALMRLNEMSLENIAIAVGYEDYNYFCRVFKQVENTAPSEYRENVLHQEQSGKDKFNKTTIEW